MTLKYFYTIATLLTVAFTIGACSKEDVPPTLTVHVQEKDGTPAPNAKVRVWPGKNTGEAGREINDPVVDLTGTTDAAGDVTFEFEASVVLDIDVEYYRNGFDTATPPSPIIDTLLGHRVVKLEAIRQKSNENTTTEVVEVK